MSTINKKPFIKSLIEDLKENEGYLEALQLLIDGSGNQIPLLRTLSIKPSGNRTNITAADAGVHLCNLEANYSLYNGYLCFSNNYCVLISFTDSQKLTMFMITDDGHNFETIDEELSVLELRSELMDISGGGSSGSGSGLPDTTPAITLTSETITLAFNEGVLPTHIKLSNGIIVDLQGNEYCAEGEETVAQSINSGRVVIVISGDFTSLPSVNMTNLIWTLIDNPNNFSFNDLPRFSDSSDVDDFPGGGGGGEGGGTSVALYKHSIQLMIYDDIEPIAHTFSFLSKYAGPFVSNGSLLDMFNNMVAKNDEQIMITPYLHQPNYDAYAVANVVPKDTTGIAFTITRATGLSDGVVAAVWAAFTDNTNITDTVTPYIEVSGSGSSVGGSSVDVIEMISNLNGTDIKLRMTFLSGELEEHKADLNAGISQINTATGLSIPLMTNLESLSDMITYLNANVPSDTAYNQCMAGFFAWVKNYSLNNMFIVPTGGSVPVSIEIISMAEGRYQVGYLGKDEVSASMSGTDSMGGQVDVSGLIPGCGYFGFMSSSLASKYTSLTIKRGASAGSGGSSSEYPKVKEINLNNYLTDAQVLQFLQVYQQGTGNAFLTTSSDFMTSAEFEEYDMIRAKAYVNGTLAFDGLLQKQVSTPAKAYGLSFGKVASSFANCCHIYFYMGSSSGNDTMNKVGVCATSLS